MKMNELLLEIAKREEFEGAETDRCCSTLDLKTRVDDDVTLNMALTLLHECGELLDRLTDTREKRLSKSVLLEIAQTADAIYDLLKETDVDYGDYLEERA